MKKALITMFVLTLIIVGVSSVSFASNNYRKVVIHEASSFNSCDFNSNQKVEAMQSLQENTEKIIEVQGELEAVIKELISLKGKEDDPTEFNILSDKDSKVESLKAIINNYRDQLQFLKTEQKEELKSIFSAEKFSKMRKKKFDDRDLSAENVDKKYIRRYFNRK